MAQIPPHRVAASVNKKYLTHDGFHRFNLFNMFTINGFFSGWQRLHHPSMDVSGDAAFYYQLYGRLHRLAGQKARRFDGPAISSLLLYTENIIAVGLDGVYEYMYRSLGDVVVRWCERLGMRADVTSQVHHLVSDAVADAPHSALRQWMMESVLSEDFPRLSDMLTWFAREDRTLRLVYPDLRYREATCLRLTGNRPTARQMLWSDMAFNWRDKYGKTLAETLADQCRLTACSTEEQESVLLRKTADLLDTIRSERLDTYTVVERKDERILTLCHRDGRIFRDVTFPVPMTGNIQEQGLVAQLVTCAGRNRVNGPFRWLASERLAGWNGEKIRNNILKQEQEAAKQTFFTTPFGKRISLYEDLYTVPEDPVEAGYARQGIYLDEPNLFNFLEWLKPADSVGETVK